MPIASNKASKPDTVNSASDQRLGDEAGKTGGAVTVAVFIGGFLGEGRSLRGFNAKEK
jgi:hypothetical protein